jgi:2-hydroxy-3-keto-5-methylthiopentenyl-1-phosphate phosphatase
MKRPHEVIFMYDFDKTLSTLDMQEYVFIPSINMQPSDFWTMADSFAAKHSMDNILSTMFLMVDRAKHSNIPITRDTLREQGKHIVYQPGVEGWFERINNYGNSQGVTVKHYIISSGLKCVIEGCSIAKYFSKIYASEFLYDDNGVPIWPSVAINYSSKTQYLYRIHKGVEDITEHTRLNRRMPEEEKQVPFTNMIYIGDGLTDVPSMKITKLNGGYSIGVYLVSDDRVSFFVPADYSPDSPIDKISKAIIKRISAEAELSELGWDEKID